MQPIDLTNQNRCNPFIKEKLTALIPTLPPSVQTEISDVENDYDLHNYIIAFMCIYESNPEIVLPLQGLLNDLVHFYTTLSEEIIAIVNNIVMKSNTEYQDWECLADSYDSTNEEKIAAGKAVTQKLLPISEEVAGFRQQMDPYVSSKSYFDQSIGNLPVKIALKTYMDNCHIRRTIIQAVAYKLSSITGTICAGNCSEKAFLAFFLLQKYAKQYNFDLEASIVTHASINKQIEPGTKPIELGDHEYLLLNHFSFSANAKKPINVMELLHNSSPLEIICDPQCRKTFPVREIPQKLLMFMKYRVNAASAEVEGFAPIDHPKKNTIQRSIYTPCFYKSASSSEPIITHMNKLLSTSDWNNYVINVECTISDFSDWLPQEPKELMLAKKPLQTSVAPGVTVTR